MPEILYCLPKQQDRKKTDEVKIFYQYFQSITIFFFLNSIPVPFFLFRLCLLLLQTIPQHGMSATSDQTRAIIMRLSRRTASRLPRLKDKKG